MKKHLIALTLALSAGVLSLHAATFTCSTAAELTGSLSQVLPGDTILLEPGTYLGTTLSINGKSCHFGSTVPATTGSPITLRSLNPADPAVLSGDDPASRYVFYLYGADNWIIQDIDFTGAQKGIVVDNSAEVLITGCRVYGIGMEGIHLRDGSSECEINNCEISDTGLHTAGYGEGVYVGTDRNSWDSYDPACYDNVISHCTFGPGVAAEHLDIKEGTRRTIVEYCLFDGTGISGANSATTYVSCKGVDAFVHHNTGYRNGNPIIDSAFSCNNRGVADSGSGNWFYYNTIYHDDTESWVVRTKEGTCTYLVWQNTRVPEGNMYQAYSGSSYEERDPGMATPPPTPAMLMGDVNGNGQVTIVDALMTAQYYVGLIVPGFNPAVADVNRDGQINIVDALMIAQYYVGLIPEL